MFLSPYQTTPCKNSVLTKIVQEIINEKIDGYLDQEGSVLQVGPRSQAVPVFQQPLTALEFGDRNNKPEIVIDCRGYVKTDRSSGARYIANASEYEFNMDRAILQLFWQKYTKSDLLRVGDLPGITFTNWISRTIAGKLGFDPEQQMILTVVCAYYYTNLFYEQVEYDDQVKTKSAQIIARWTRIPVARIFEIIDPLEYLANIKEFVGAIHKSIESPRVEPIDVGFLYALLGSGWFSTSRETVCVALEHPPTFIALIKASMESRSYRSATIAKVALMAVKGGNDKDFLNGLAFLLKGLN